MFAVAADQAGRLRSMALPISSLRFAIVLLSIPEAVAAMAQSPLWISALNAPTRAAWQATAPQVEPLSPGVEWRKNNRDTRSPLPYVQALEAMEARKWSGRGRRSGAS